MAKPTEKPEAKPAAGQQRVNGGEKVAKERKRLPPAKSYTVKRGFG